MKLFTVIYTSYIGFAGSLVHCAHITVKPGETLIKALERVGVDPGALTQVFHGHQESIEQDWSTL